jgi:hypothetical protein
MAGKKRKKYFLLRFCCCCWIQDPGWKKLGPVIWDEHTGYATLVSVSSAILLLIKACSIIPLSG